MSDTYTDAMSDDNSTDGVERSTCATKGCQRTPVVVHSFAPGDEPRESEKAELCLPCRRVIEFAMRIPWGDQSENWADKDALQEFVGENEPVSSERYLDTESEQKVADDE